MKDELKKAYRLLQGIRKHTPNVVITMSHDGVGGIWADKPYCAKCDKDKLFGWSSFEEAIEKLQQYLDNLNDKKT